MFSKRGQIGSNEMVYLAIAIIVLVLVVGGFVFNWGGMKDKLGGLTGGGKTYASFAQECELACQTSSSDFCIKERSFKIGAASYSTTCNNATIDASLVKNVTTKTVTNVAFSTLGQPKISCDSDYVCS